MYSHHPRLCLPTNTRLLFICTLVVFSTLHQQSSLFVQVLSDGLIQEMTETQNGLRGMGEFAELCNTGK